MGMRRSKARGSEQFLREGRGMILAASDALYHALGCEPCGLRTQALTALALVGWTEADFVTAEMQSRA